MKVIELKVRKIVSYSAGARPLEVCKYRINLKIKDDFIIGTIS